MELITIGEQTVESKSPIIFQTAVSAGSPSIWWREGSGFVNLRGLGPQARARFRVLYHANVALATDATVEPIALAITINGEPINSSQTLSTPGAVSEYNSVSATTLIDVPFGCCTSISLENIGTTSITVQNANLIVERVA